MGFNSDNYRRIRAEYDNKFNRARQEADVRRAELHGAIPSLRAVDAELGRTGLQIMQALVAGGEETERQVAKIRERNESLQKSRDELLRKHGYPVDYSDVHYECGLCSDTGFVDGKMCSCMRRELIIAGCESSGIGRLMREQNFGNFSLEYYSDNKAAFNEMELVLNAAYRFAESFGTADSENILLMGGTGLGKTHLSSAVARRVIERGFDVYYTGAQGMISDFERERFGNSSTAGGGADVSRYFNCDLLIIDDLGTEVSNQFTVSCLFNVINTRLNLRRSTMISTNLNPRELVTRYTDRIASRILGEFRPLQFKGTDVRLQKLTKNTGK